MAYMLISNSSNKPKGVFGKYLKVFLNKNTSV